MKKVIFFGTCCINTINCVIEAGCQKGFHGDASAAERRIQGAGHSSICNPGGWGAIRYQKKEGKRKNAGGKMGTKEENKLKLLISF